MTTFFNSVQIRNFKSLKDVTLSDCRRINLLIGKPNVGKSNILEAIGLFSLPYIKYNKSKKITQFVRLENIAELFFDGNIEEKINIKADDGSFCSVEYLPESGFVGFEINLENQDVAYELYGNLPTVDLKTSESHTLIADNKLSLVGSYKKHDYPSPKVKYYKFPHTLISKAQDLVKTVGLIPPSGVNFFDIIQKGKLKDELSGLFTGYGLQLLLDKTNQTVRIMKALKDNKTMVSLPYSSIADTLQRVIFFKTAITSNKNSILLFEEPEAHCFPPYITHIAREIIDSESNQFFIATHSPYILDTFLEKDRDDLAIYMADFKDGQTVIKRLTDAELNDVYEYGLDLFFNAELFTDEI
ncbi:MAG: AAA family ATPase [Methylobacter sp.]|nr:AAA family ATPase [Methylococcales bacterium]MDD5112588.1 AAA family ATPase [Methylobacter sp.]